VDRDITYCTAAGTDLKMDVYYPVQQSSKAPLAVYVHGGAFISGDKATGSGLADVAELLRRGYVVASLDYRLAPKYPFPAAIEDVKCGIRSLRANALKYGVDANRIGAWGTSAGGTLVALLGLADTSAGMEGEGGYSGVSSRVQAVVDMFGVSDLTPPGVRVAVRAFVPGSGAAADALAAKASPITHISADDPPFLILHGDKDAVVGINQSQLLFDRLQAAGVPSEFIVVRNGGHGFVPTGAPISPSRAEISRKVADFFDALLKGN
jgi:acetyl esterase/lipase